MKAKVLKSKTVLICIVWRYISVNLLLYPCAYTFQWTVLNGLIIVNIINQYHHFNVFRLSIWIRKLKICTKIISLWFHQILWFNERNECTINRNQRSISNCKLTMSFHFIWTVFDQMPNIVVMLAILSRYSIYYEKIEYKMQTVNDITYKMNEWMN